MFTAPVLAFLDIPHVTYFTCLCLDINEPWYLQTWQELKMQCIARTMQAVRVRGFSVSVVAAKFMYFRVTSVILGLSYYCLTVRKFTLKNMGKSITWIQDGHMIWWEGCTICMTKTNYHGMELSHTGLNIWTCTMYLYTIPQWIPYCVLLWCYCLSVHPTGLAGTLHASFWEWF